MMRWLAVLLVLSGCDADDPRTTDTHSVAPAPSSFDEIRRPARSYVVIHSGDGCSVHWLQDGRRSIGKTVPCPRELEAGERMRLAGRTCIRESERAERNVPIRCNKELFYAEKADKEGQGEWHLPVDPTAE